MRTTNLSQEQNQMMNLDNNEMGEDKQQNQHHKPLWAMMIHKTVPIGYEYHQVHVSDFHPPSSPLSHKHLPPPLSPPVYLRTRVHLEELEEFLAFVENFFEEKIPDYFSQGINSRDRARSKAMQFLHEMGYNYIRTKFYMLFPYYLTFNHFKCHQPLMLSDEEMTRRIAEHLQGLKSTKEKDLQRWIGTVQNSIQSRIHINKLNTLIEVAKQNKFQIPEAIREQVQRSVRTGREIKKALHSTRLPLDKLIIKRESLQQCKIITNEMIQFQETVGRCEQWLKKQQKFEQTFFTPQHSKLRALSTKIQFRTLQLLVSEFNNLPLIYENFQKTTGTLYANTLTLLERLPPLNKAAKTRTAQNLQVSSKISIETIQQFLAEIEACPVEHEQFTLFEGTIRQNIEWLQRIGLWLQDQKSQKSLKILNQYAKIINDIPISNRIQLKLQSRLQYYEIMQRVKKDISNPAKYEQIKQAIKKLKEKGYQTCQYSKLETRIISYMGWYQSQQILNEDRVPPTVLDLTTKFSSIKQRMISEQAFKSQLLSARHQLNIPQQVWIQSEGKVRAVQELRLKIKILQQQEEPLLQQIVQVIKATIKNGLLFAQFQSIYNRMVQIFNLLAQIQYLLINSTEQFLEADLFYFKEEEVHLILANLIDSNGLQVKDLQTKQTGDYLLKQAKNSGFPKKIPQYRIFQLFMAKAGAWSEKAIQMISAFKQQNIDDFKIRELIDQSKNYLHSRSIQQQLGRIDIVLKWRQKISRKLSENKQSPFTSYDQAFLKQLEHDLQQAQSLMQSGQTTKIRALEYLSKWGARITEILQKISTVQIQCTYKLSQMNKFCKQIDRQIQKYRLQDKVILELKQQLQRQLQLSDQWKEKYLAIKRFERKKQKKQEEEIKQLPQVDISINLRDEEAKINGSFLNIQTPTPIPYIPTLIGGNMLEQNKKKYYIRNGQFCWYFKLLLMIFEFYNGYNLRFVIEELVRLRSTLLEIFKFICHYNILLSKEEKTDQQLLMLETEGSKFPIFFREIYVLGKKNAYITSWKQLADSVIKSVPVLSMELKARKPEQLLELLQLKKNQKEQAKVEQGRGQQLGTKRKRKQNPFYSNEDMTLITEQTFGLKGKKKRKGLNPDSQYRNTAVASTAKKLARSQREEVERAQAILRSQVPTQLIHIDDPKEYCICRYGVPNQNSVMIQCEYRCQQWFHIECLGIKKHQAKSDIKLKCVGCRALYKEESVGYFFWDSHAKVTEYALKQLVQEGRQLGVETSEIKKLQLLYAKVQSWKIAVKDILRKVCETNGEDLPALEAPLYQLYLQSLWLPSAHPQSNILRKLVLMARNEL